MEMAVRKLTIQQLEEPVGKYAHSDIMTLSREQTTGEALALLRGKKEIVEQIIYFYVVDQDGRISGVVPVRRLLTAELHEKIADIMLQKVVTLPETASVLTACEFFLLHKFLALPVVDDEKRLKGVVDINLFTDEVVKIAEQRRVDEVFQLIGVHVVHGRRLPAWRNFLLRFPWLFANISSGIICAFIASSYELMIEQFVILALFITVVLALAESVSMQAMSITLQSILREKFSWGSILFAVRKELGSAALLGAASGAILGSIAVFWRQEYMAALSIGVSVMLSMITACLLGVAIPATVRLFRADPKIASGPIVLAMADIATIIFYFSVSAWLLK